MSKRGHKVIDADGVPTDPEERGRWVEAAIKEELQSAAAAARARLGPREPHRPEPDHGIEWNPQRLRLPTGRPN